MERLIRIVVMEQFGLFLINSSFRHIICYNEKYMEVLIWKVLQKLIKLNI